MAIGQTGAFDPRDFKNMVREIAELNKKVEEQSKDAKIDNLIDLKQRRDLFGVSARNLEEFKEARKGIKNQRDALEKLREEFGEGITETKRYRKIEERLKKDEIKQNRLLLGPLSRKKEEIKEETARNKRIFSEYLGPSSFFGKTMGKITGIFTSIGGFLTRQTATITKILGAGLTVAALFGLANFLESETFKNMIPKIKDAIANIVKGFEEGGILGGLKVMGEMLLDLIKTGIEKSGLGDKIRIGLDKIQEKIDNFFDNFFDRPDVIGTLAYMSSGIIAAIMSRIMGSFGLKAGALNRRMSTVAGKGGARAGMVVGQVYETDKGGKRLVTGISKGGKAITQIAPKGAEIGAPAMGRLAAMPDRVFNMLTGLSRIADLPGMKTIVKAVPALGIGALVLGLTSTNDKVKQTELLSAYFGSFVGAALGGKGGGLAGGILGTLIGGIPGTFIGGLLGGGAGLLLGGYLGGKFAGLAGREIAEFMMGNITGGKLQENIVNLMKTSSTAESRAPGNAAAQDLTDRTGVPLSNTLGGIPLTSNLPRSNGSGATESLASVGAVGNGTTILVNNNTDASVKTSSTNNNLMPDEPVDVAFRNQTGLGYNVAGIA